MYIDRMGGIGTGTGRAWKGKEATRLIPTYVTIIIAQLRVFFTSSKMKSQALYSSESPSVVWSCAEKTARCVWGFMVKEGHWDWAYDVGQREVNWSDSLYPSAIHSTMNALI